MVKATRHTFASSLPAIVCPQPHDQPIDQPTDRPGGDDRTTGRQNGQEIFKSDPQGVHPLPPVPSRPRGAAGRGECNAHRPGFGTP